MFFENGGNSNQFDSKSFLNRLLNFPLKSIQDLNLILYGINRLTGAQTSGIFFSSENRLVYIATYGKNDHSLLFQSLLPDESIEGRIFQTGEEILIAKSIENQYFKPDSSSSNVLMPITIAGVPVLLDKKIIGGIMVFNREKNTLFTPDDISVMKKISIYISDFLSKSSFSTLDKKRYNLNRYLISHLPYPIIITSTTGKIEEASDSFQNLLGSGEVFGKYFFDIAKLYGKNGEELNMKQIFENVITKEKEKVIKNVKVNNKYELLFNCHIKYINPERMIHNLLIYLINTEDVDDEKQKIVTSIAHELRTPMTAIMGSVQILLSDFASSELTPTQQEFLTILKNETERFSNILSTILDFKESSDMLGLRQEKIKVNDIIFDLGNIFKIKILKKDIFFQVRNFDSEITINGDIDAVKQIFYQIIDNAIKFSPLHGIVKVLYEGTKLEDTRWRHIISIEDEGEGIDPSILPHIFESFKREDEAVHSKTGTGLGLSIVKEILDTMGGSIEVANKKEKGTKVTLYF